jgi:hypothetical protein
MQIKFDRAIFTHAFKKISPNGILFIKSKFFLCAYFGVSLLANNTLYVTNRLEN